MFAYKAFWSVGAQFHDGMMSCLENLESSKHTVPMMLLQVAQDPMEEGI